DFILSFKPKMKISNIISVLFFFIIMSLQSQTIYFNNRYESVTNLWNGSVSILELNNEYLIGGTTGHPNNNYWHQISLIKLDNEGNKIIEKIIGDTSAERDISIGSLALNSVNEIYFSGTFREYTTDWVHDRCMLVKMDENLDTVWTKYYGEMVEPYDTSYLSRHLTLIPDNGFIIIGSKSPYGLPSKILVIKIDDIGNKIWEKTIGTGSYFYQGFSAIQTTDGGYAIGGYRFYIGQNETADPIIYKTDSLGNQEWEKNLGGSFDDYHPMLTLGKDGNIVAGTSYCDSMITPSDPMRITNIVKLNNEGTILWNKKYGSSIHLNNLLNIRTTENGDYIACGKLVSDFPHRSGWLLKVNESGDSLWYRQYDNLLGTDSRNYLYDVIPTSDNGFAACGYVIPYPPDTGSQDAWVLKLDSLGCDTPGCNTGVNMFERIAEGKGELNVWPNPAKDKFKIKSKKFKVEGEKIIRIYNSQGLKVEEIKVPDREETTTVNVQGWPKGIYFVQIVVGGETSANTKVIVY
ncbi:MAG: T9SS type A sorting domain-containing protein, partial [Bacteroidales bacterium]|nr:T9SS type A sorting domain-containing protein [Bacteroidales bacterium]